MGLHHRTSLNAQGGSAIIFAVGMSLLVSAISVALLLWMMLDIRRAEQLTVSSDRLAGLEIVEAMAAEKINRAQNNLRDAWEIMHQDTMIEVTLSELSGRVNINTLHKRDQSKDAVSSFSPSNVIERLLDSTGVTGAHDVVQKLETSGSSLFSLSSQPELKPAVDFLYAADPEIQQVNINSTTAEVLASILDISSAKASSILSEAPFESTQDIINVLAKHELKYDPITPLEAWFSVEGKYYILESQFSGKRKSQIYSIFLKDNEKITLLSRSWGKSP
jgi:type II secretory pathway component PulK